MDSESKFKQNNLITGNKSLRKRFHSKQNYTQDTKPARYCVLNTLSNTYSGAFL